MRTGILFVKRTIGAMGCLMLAVPTLLVLVNVWFEKHPESERRLANAADNMDSHASFTTKASQFISGYKSASEDAREAARNKQREQSDAERERREREFRAFNQGDRHYYNDDYYPGDR